MKNDRSLEEILGHRAPGVQPDYVPEQERNFDAGHMPTETPLKHVRTERIDGKLYEVFTI